MAIDIGAAAPVPPSAADAAAVAAALQNASPVRHGPIASLMRSLKSGKSNVFGVLGDSTGNEIDEWPYRLGQLIGAALPNIRVQHALFDDTSSRYGDWTVIQAGPSGERYLQLGGTKGRFLTEAEVDDISTGDLCVDVKLSMDDWTPAAEQTIASHYGGAGVRGWRLYISTAGQLNFQWSNDGTTLLTLSTAGSLGYTDGTTHWVRATIDLDNGASGYDAKLYKSDDGQTWSQVATVTGGAPTSIFNPSANVEIGSRSGGSTAPMAGKVYDVRIQSAYDTTAHTMLQPWPMEAWHSLATDGNTLGGSPTLYILNGSVPGAGLTYLTNATRFPRMLFKSMPGLVILSTSHNDAGNGGSPWLASWDAWLAQVRARAPGIGVAALLQNPRKTPADYIDDHATRMSMLPTWAEQNRVDVIDGWSPFFSAGALTSALINSDGIHPDTSGGGKELLAQAVARRFLTFA